MLLFGSPARCLVWFVIVLLNASGCDETSPDVPAARESQSSEVHRGPDENPPQTYAVAGKVVSVKDGDTIVILNNQEQITVRLEGIDCPESGQAFGTKAKQMAAELCFEKQVNLRITGSDRYGRTLAHVLLPDGRSLNEELVRSGYAWWFQKYSDDPKLEKLEADAKSQKRGLWADSRSIAPWDWRAAQRAKPDLLASEIEIIPNGVTIVSLLPNPTGEDAGYEQVTLRNSTSVAVNLSNWKLMDKAGNVFLLSGTISSREEKVVTMTEATMPLNNDGDLIIMMDSEGIGRSRVSYSGSQVRSGGAIEVGE